MVGWALGLIVKQREGKLWARAAEWPLQEAVEGSEYAGSGLASLGDLVRLWGTGAISSCLVLSPGATRLVFSGLEIKSPIGNVVGGVDSELIGFYLKSTSLGRRTPSKDGEWGVGHTERGRKPRQGDAGILSGYPE